MCACCLKGLRDLQAMREESGLPALLLLVTGRGPQKAHFQAAMQKLELRRVAFRTLWLEPGDYPLLLGTCDVGVSLHTSSSGLDLPMKVSTRPAWLSEWCVSAAEQAPASRAALQLSC